MTRIEQVISKAELGVLRRKGILLQVVSEYQGKYVVSVATEQSILELLKYEYRPTFDNVCPECGCDFLVVSGTVCATGEPFNAYYLEPDGFFFVAANTDDYSTMDEQVRCQNCEWTASLEEVTL